MKQEHNEHVNGFGDTGCGITSVAMVLSYLTDEKVSIQDVVDWCDDPKYGDTYLMDTVQQEKFFKEQQIIGM